MDELSAKWQDLTDIQQASIQELLAGQRQGNVLSAVLENFDIARDVVTTSENSDGSALAEHAEWLESLEAKINQFKAAWQDLSQAVLDDEALGTLIDTGTTLLNVLEALIDNFGLLNTAIVGVGLTAFIKNFD